MASIESKRDEDFLNGILDAMADPLFVKDKEHRWVAVNQAFCEFMGHPRNSLLGKSDFDFFPESEASTFWKKDAEVFTKGGVNSNEEPFTDVDGVTHTIITKKTIFTDRIGSTYLVGTIRDISDLKCAQADLETVQRELELRVEKRTREVQEAQESLRQAQKMQAVGQLTGGVAHDFNNLLTIIMGSIEHIRHHLPGDSMVEQLANQALEACRSGASLTQGLLAFSKKQALQPSAININHLLVETTRFLQRTLGEKIQIKTRSSELSCVANIDRTQLEAALLNLCLNARDAMPNGGTIEISFDRIRFDHGVCFGEIGLDPGPYILIEIADQGVGMDSATLGRVFEPFFSTKDSGRGGRGLGLSMVYGFVTQSKGGISINSTKQRGTTVRLFLPESTDAARREPSRGDADVPEVLPKQDTKEVILLVEDDPQVRKLICMLLRNLEYKVFEAGSARESYELLPTLQNVDLLLTDVVLEGREGGSHVADMVLSHYPDAKILFMSGYTDATLDKDWAERGYQLLQKPFHLADLKQAILEALLSKTREGNAPIRANTRLKT